MEPGNLTSEVDVDDYDYDEEDDEDDYDDKEREEVDYDDWEDYKAAETFVDELKEIISKSNLPFEKFGDDTIDNATIEQGIDSEASTALMTAKIEDGKRKSMLYRAYKSERQSCNHLRFVVTGELKYFRNRASIVRYIEERGGIVDEAASNKTIFLICNNIDSNSIEMKTAQELGVTLLTEAAFIRRFGNPTEFDLIDDESLSDNSFKCTMNGDIMDFLIDNGACPIIMEVWQNGRWARPAFRKKNR